MSDYARPLNLHSALQLLKGSDHRLLAGGTDTYPAAGNQLSGSVLDLSGIPDLGDIRFDAGLRIGAGVSWTEIATADVPPALAALQTAARAIGGVQIQNVGTIGGNLCNASPAADGVPPLLVLDAEVELASWRGSRRIPLSAFILGPGKTALLPDEMLVAVHIPQAALAGRSTFRKLGARAYLVISIVMVAVRLRADGDRIGDIAIAVGACSGVAQRLPMVERALRGGRLRDAVALIREKDLRASLAPIDDIRATASYRADAALELVSRAVAEVAG